MTLKLQIHSSFESCSSLSSSTPIQSSLVHIQFAPSYTHQYPLTRIHFPFPFPFLFLFLFPIPLPIIILPLLFLFSSFLSSLLFSPSLPSPPLSLLFLTSFPLPLLYPLISIPIILLILLLILLLLHISLHLIPFSFQSLLPIFSLTPNP